MMNHYRKSWALRSLREAKAELVAARRMPYMAPNLIREALRKAQIAVYYSLGEPMFIENVVQQAMRDGKQMRDPILRYLVEIESFAQQISETPDLNVEKTTEQVDDLIQIASSIVEAYTGEKNVE